MSDYEIDSADVYRVTSDLTERLVGAGMSAIDDAGFAPTIEERRVYSQVVTVSVLRNLADEIDAADEDSVLWPDSGDLRLLANEIEAD